MIRKGAPRTPDGVRVIQKPFQSGSRTVVEQQAWLMAGVDGLSTYGKSGSQ